jgi:hypothetical protein
MRRGGADGFGAPVTTVDISRRDDQSCKITGWHGLF